MGDLDTRTDPRVGARLANRYRIEQRLDAGGMATVYQARDEILNRDVAIKIMHPALAADGSFVERFRNEGQNAARLSHPNIVTVYDYGEGDAGAGQQDLFMVMELCEGTTLRTLLERFGRLDPPTARHVTRGIAAALDHAHSKGIVHRDVKPENILLTPDGQVKVVDFGIAKALGPHAAHLTTDRPIGTVAYVAPEQLSSTNVDGRADVYALGAVTYEMLAGRPPFFGDTPQAVAAARMQGTALNPGISPEIDAAVSRATQGSPDARFDTPGDFARALGDSGTPTFLMSTDNLPNVAPLKPVPSAPKPTASATTAREVDVLPFQMRYRKRKGRRVRAAFGSLIALAIIGVAAYALMPRPTTVPDVRGQTLAEAKAAVSREALRVGSIDHAFHDVALEGTIVGTDPDPGTAVKKDVAITLLVSKGPQLFEVPDVIGKQVDEAKTLMTQAGFTLSVGEEAYNDDVVKGAIASFDPNRRSAKRGTSFVAVVSKGPPLVAVPNIDGKNTARAREAIEATGFTFASSEDYSATVEVGKVISSNPAADEMAPKGSTVTAIISKGPRPFPMPDLVGMARGAAKEKAKSLGLVIRNEYPVPGSGKPKGVVQGQNPVAGTSVRKGAAIDIYYST